MKYKWKKISSKIAHENPWFRVREDDVIRPDGKAGKYFVVDTSESVSVIACDKDEKIYLVGQSRYPIGKFSWEIVTGAGDEGVAPLVNAKRELQEEAGLKASKWIKLGHFNPGTGHSSEKCTLFLARGLSKIKPNREPSEDIILRKESLEKILAMINNNEITCGLTITSILKYLLYKNKKL
ncbi:NUDIX hydrolase [Candidatus Falkowbacteria bacterium]|nr:NUDIX hydrolase [Candidatus Falkowbacteria bacterium]